MMKKMMLLAVVAMYGCLTASAQGPFSGRVGTEGCEAIAHNDPAIVAWATGCTVVRGSQNLSNPEAPLVTFGSDAAATGPAGTSVYTVVSLGDGGSATLTFEVPIADGPGPDLAVFENSFDDYFLELAFVEVSSDGQRFVRFPATSLTQTETQIGGTGQVDATMINNLAGKYRVGYGTPFDLAELADSAGLDISAVTHVRVVDAVGSIDPALGTRDAAGRMVNDPFPTTSYSAGFDLDAVAVLHQATNALRRVPEVGLRCWPNPCSASLTVSAPEGTEAALCDMQGRRLVAVGCGGGPVSIDLSALPAGVYFLRAGGAVRKIVKR